MLDIALKKQDHDKHKLTTNSISQQTMIDSLYMTPYLLSAASRILDTVVNTGQCGFHFVPREFKVQNLNKQEELAIATVSISCL
jgi:hypothetical protein